MIKLMIVDDEPLSLNCVTDYIRERFPDVTITATCKNGEEAYQMFLQDPVDLLITDIRMPKMDGLQLVSKLQVLNRDLLCVIISGYDDFSYAKTAMSLGIMHYLLKPVDFDELHRCMDALLQRMRQNRMIQSTNSTNHEEQESFVLDILSGTIQEERIVKRYDALSFLPSLTESSGSYISIRITNRFEEYTYERETIATALENLINMVCRPLQIVTVYRSTESYEFVLLKRKWIHPSELQKVRTQVRDILKMDADITIIQHFSTICDLFLKGTNPVLDNSGVQNSEDNNRRSILAAIEYIQQHYNDDLTREEMASKVYMSCSHFSRCFKEVTGYNFLDYLTEIRMKQAICYLNTNVKVQEISKMVGYKSKNRFLINFRNYTSYTPTEYRKNVLKILV